MGKKRASKSIKKEKIRKDSEKTRSRYFSPAVLLCAIAALTIIVYLRSLHAPLVLDDVVYIKSSKLKNIWWYLSLHARSVSSLTFAINYYFSGMNLAAFRMTNVIIHVITTTLVFYLTYVTLTLPSVRNRYQWSGDGKTPLYIALLVAALFSLHPIQTSAVNYITQRMAVMAGMFSFAGFIAYVKGATNTGRKMFLYYFAAALFFFLAVFSKENAVMALPMLIVYDLVFISSFRWNEFRKRSVPLLALLAVIAVAAAYFLGRGGFIGKIATLFLNPYKPMESLGWSGVDINWTPIEYVLTEFRVVSRYILLIFVPVPSLMAFDYSNAFPVSRSLFDPVTTLFSLLFVVGLFVFSLVYIRKFTLLSFGILWYIVVLSLESFIALGLDPYFEHRNYLPSYGLFFAAASLLVYLRRPGLDRYGKIVIPVAVVVLFLTTYVRNGVWTTEESLWKDAVKRQPGNARALISLSTLFIREGRFQDAQQYIDMAGNVRPLADKYRIDMLFNQASVYKETNRKAQALDVLRDIEAQNVLSSGMRSNVNFFMGDILRETGDLPQARKYLEAAYKDSRFRVRTPVLVVTLGVVCKSLGEVDRAESYFREAVEIEPNLIIPYVELGDIYLTKKDLKKAETNYGQVAFRKGPVREDMRRRALLGLAQAKLMLDKPDESAELFKNIIGIAPGYYPPYIFLGGIYLAKKDFDGALSYLQKALALKERFIRDEPNAKLLYFYLGKAYLGKGDSKSARKNLDIFLSVSAGDERLKRHVSDARKELARIGE